MSRLMIWVLQRPPGVSRPMRWMLKRPTGGRGWCIGMWVMCSSGYFWSAASSLVVWLVGLILTLGFACGIDQ